MTIDWNTFSLDDGNSWEMFYNDHYSYPQNFIYFLKKGIALEHEEVMSKIIASIAVHNSKVAKILPIIYTFGKSGTGKSQLGYLIAAFRNQAPNIFSGASTFAGIRNTLDDLRWINSLEPRDFSLANERPYLLVWADVKESDFRKADGSLFTMFRCGSYRTEEKIKISDGHGGTFTFHCFGLKVVSTTDLFVLRPEWDELHRRCLFLPMKAFGDLPPDYMAEFEEREKIDFYSINWSGIEAKYDAHWTPERALTIQQMYRNKNKMFSYAKKHYEHLTTRRLEISFDLMIQGYVSDIFASLEDCYNVWNNYWGIVSQVLTNAEKPPLRQILEQLVDAAIARTEQANQVFLANGKEHLVTVPAIEPRIIKDAIQENRDKGVLDSVKHDAVKAEMYQLGFALRKHGTKFVWVKE